MASNKGDCSEMNDDIENVNKLLHMDVGDQGRLQYIQESLMKNSKLFKSDKNYLENLTKKYLEIITDSENSDNDEVLKLKKKIHDLEQNCECKSQKTEMLKSVFSTSRQNIADLGVLFARFGIGFSFLWAGFGKVSDPNGFAQMLQGMIGISSEMAPMMASLIGGLELIAGAFFVLGLLTRFSSIFAIIILMGSLAMFGLDFGSGPAIWKDPSILGLAFLLMLYGSGKFGVDSKISIMLSKTKY